MTRLTIFLDRDGVINMKRPEDDYVKSWDEFKFIEGSLDALRLLANAKIRVIVVTNQRGIARGRMTAEDVANIHRRMIDAVHAAGGRIDAIYTCPHEIGACKCRKPEIGLFEEALREFPEVDPRRSVVIGDSLSDLSAAARLNIPAVLIAEQDKGETMTRRAAEEGIYISSVAPSLLAFVRGYLRPDLPFSGPSPAGD